MSTLNGGPGKIITNGLVLYLDAANPTYAPSRNLLNNTTDLTNAASWNIYNSALTASAAIAPDGTNTAYAWNISTAGTSSLVRLAGQSNNSPILSAVSGGQYTFSVYVKNKNCTATEFNLSIYNGAYTIGHEPAYSITSSFNPVGADPVSATFANGIRRSENVGNGWNRISYTTTVTSSLSSFNVFFDIESGGGTKIAGEGIYIWGPQFETGASPTQYQPIVSTAKTWPSITGQSLNATLYNNTTYIGSNAGTMVFNGANQYASIPNNALLNTDATPFTVEMCIKLPSNVPASSQYLYSKLNNSFVLYLYNNNLYMGKDVVSDWAIVSIASYLNNNLYITAGWDGTNKFCYLNGVNVINSAQSTFLIASTSNPLYLGGTGAISFNGSMYLVRNYNRALSQSEITQNFNATRARFGI